MTNPIIDLIEEAQRARPDVSVGTNQDQPRYIKRKAASLRTLVLNKSNVPVLNAQGQLTSAPHANIAAQTIPVSTAIAKGSRVAEAGASLIYLPDHFTPQFIGTNLVTMKTREFPKAFVDVDAAPFALVDDDADVALSDRPVNLAPIELDDLRQYSVKFKVNHKEQVDRGNEQVANEILAGIVAGISRTCDEVYLNAVLAKNPEVFTLAKAAAKGAKIDTLRGLVGTLGYGASWRGDGKFAVADGIPADITAAIELTVVGWFERGAVMLGPDLSILAERTNKNGDLIVTSWFSLNALIPDGNKFWTVEDQVVVV